jgi:hypothetical protein
VSGLLCVTDARKDGEAGILGEAGIGQREIAEDEDRATRGFDAAGLETIGAKAGAQGITRLLLRIMHENKDNAGRGAVIS